MRWKRFWHRVDHYNERILAKGSEIFGSSWTFFLFFFWAPLAYLPWMPSSFKEFVLIVSSAWVQLWALSILAIGSNIKFAAADKRAAQDHRTILAEFDKIQCICESMEKILARLDRIEDALEIKHALPENATGIAPGN
jgi:hypothetical protein